MERGDDRRHVELTPWLNHDLHWNAASKGMLDEMGWTEDVLQIPVDEILEWTFLHSANDHNFYRVSYPVAVKIFKATFVCPLNSLSFSSKQEERKVASDALHEIALSASLHHRQLVGFIGLVENVTDTLSDRSLLDPVGYVMQYFPGEQLEILLDELSQKSENSCCLSENNGLVVGIMIPFLWN